MTSFVNTCLTLGCMRHDGADIASEPLSKYFLCLPQNIFYLNSNYFYITVCLQKEWPMSNTEVMFISVVMTTNCKPYSSLITLYYNIQLIQFIIILTLNYID